jgi:hypothetical protein
MSRSSAMWLGHHHLPLYGDAMRLIWQLSMRMRCGCSVMDPYTWPASSWFMLETTHVMHSATRTLYRHMCLLYIVSVTLLHIVDHVCPHTQNVSMKSYWRRGGTFWFCRLLCCVVLWVYYQCGEWLYSGHSNEKICLLNKLLAASNHYF